MVLDTCADYPILLLNVIVINNNFSIQFMTMSANTIFYSRSKSILTKYWPCILVLLAFAGFISKALYNYPVSIMALLGFYRLLTNHKILVTDKILRSASIVFLCLWLPLLFSLPDAVNPVRSAQTTFAYLRFYFSCIFIVHEIFKDKDRLSFIVTGLFYLVLFWCVDATIQFAFNKDLFGFPYQPGQITGMFYPRNTISHICSILSTFSFIYIYKNFKDIKWPLLSIVPLFFIVLLSGRRAAWVMLALSAFGYLIYGYKFALNKVRFIKITSLVSAVIAAVLVSTILFHPPTNHRFKVTLGLFSENYESINSATAVRLPIWETAISVIKSNPINGIGPRGFRYVYKDYASESDIFVHWDIIPTQPHIIILEILAETGIIGFIGYLLAFYFIVRIVVRSDCAEQLSPFLIPVIVAMFPFNAHMAFYGSIWSSMVWLLISLYFSQARLLIKNH